MSEERCWICLEGERESGEPLLQACKCSLRAHESCLVAWAAGAGSEAERERETQRDNEPRDVMISSEEVTAMLENGLRTSRESSVSSLGIGGGRWWSSHGVGLLPSWMTMRTKTRTVTRVSCPQCRRKLYVVTKSSLLVAGAEALQRAICSCVKHTALLALGSSVVSSLAVAACGLLTSVGYRLASTLCGAPVTLLRLLGVPTRMGSFSEALARDAVSSKALLQLGTLPLFLYELKSSRASSYQLSILYPLLFQGEGGAGSLAKVLMFIPCAKLVYKLVYSLTANRLYYHWVRRFKPAVLTAGLPLEEVEQFEEEEQHRDQQVLRASRRHREFASVLQHDYYYAFNNDSVYANIASVLLWPALSSHLARITRLLPLNGGLAHYYGEDAIFVENLIAGGVITVMKELLNLLVTWRKVQQLSSLAVLQYNTRDWLLCKIQDVKQNGLSEKDAEDFLELN